MLQKKLEERNSYVTSQIFDNIVNYLPELIMDPFGNYLSQKLFEMIDAQQLQTTLDVIIPHMITASLNPHGTRAI